MKRAQLTGTILACRRGTNLSLVHVPTMRNPKKARIEVAIFYFLPSSRAPLILFPCLGTPETPGVA